MIDTGVTDNDIDDNVDNKALHGPIVPTFFFYFIPSALGLLAMSTASVVDGVFVGNHVGSTALAAINILIPFLSFMFGFGMMVGVGGSVSVGKYIGEGRFDKASAMFSQNLLVNLGIALAVVLLGLLFEKQLFRAFGANDELFSLMSSYFRVLLPFLPFHLLAFALYLFVRLDGYPRLASASIVIGAIVNVVLDWLFIVELDFGISGAAWATGISQCLPFLILLSYFFFKKRTLHFRTADYDWGEMLRSSFNGISEFINEVSGGVIMFALNWLMMLSVGVNGVAALSVILYLLYVGLMIFFSIAGTCQVFVSQNFGARKMQRIKQFTTVCNWAAVFVSAVCILLLIAIPDVLIGLFLDGNESQEVALLAAEYIQILWAIFLFMGFNTIVTSYLTALHLPVQSGIIALSRSLILPVGFALGIFLALPEVSFLWSLPLAEFLTFFLATIFFLRHRPWLQAV